MSAGAGQGGLQICLELLAVPCLSPHVAPTAPQTNSCPNSLLQVFKICLEYWNFFVPDVYSSVCTVEPSSTAAVTSVRAGGRGREGSEHGTCGQGVSTD